MRIRKITFTSRPFAFHNVAYLPKDMYDLPESDLYRKSKIKHELVHLKQQGSNFFKNIFWVMKYILNKKFRRETESEAFVAEIAFRVKNNIQTVDSQFVSTMVNKYCGAFNKDQAWEVIRTGYKLAGRHVFGS